MLTLTKNGSGGATALSYKNPEQYALLDGTELLTSGNQERRGLDGLPPAENTAIPTGCSAGMNTTSNRNRAVTPMSTKSGLDYN
jgi:hypothetical protein